MSTIINGTSSAITFPDSTVQNTAFTGSASTITSGTLPFSVMPTGSVLQVVSTSYNTETTITTSAFTATGISVSITPKFSSSKILIVANVPSNSSAAGNSNIQTIYRNSTTNLANSGSVQGFSQLYAGSSNTYTAIGMSVLDSPATTSSTNYKVYFQSGNGTNAVTVCPNSETATITVMEIAA